MTPHVLPGSQLRARAAEQPDRVIFIHVTDDVAVAQERGPEGRLRALGVTHP